MPETSPIALETKRNDTPLALVMSGGGARAAYQVGMLRCLARRFPTVTMPILTGVSAGAINAGFLASRSGTLASKVEELTGVWSTLTADQVFKVDTLSLAKNVLRTGFKLVSGGAAAAPHTHAMVDTAPLRALLEKLIGPERIAGVANDPDDTIRGITRNIAAGELRAVAITTSSYSTGQSITWVQGCDMPMWERAHRKSICCELTVSHVMASTSLPIFFPAVQVDGHWYGDGGIRLTAPLSPAIHLGARKIIAISTRYGRSRVEADAPAIEAYPPPAQVVGALFNAIFLDLFDADALGIERVNNLIATMKPEQRGSLQPIELLVMRPSRDLGKLANDYEARLPRAFRFMTRGLGTRETKSNDLLSLVMFQPDYLSRLIELGEKDAEARLAEIERFLTGTQGVGTR